MVSPVQFVAIFVVAAILLVILAVSWSTQENAKRFLSMDRIKALCPPNAGHSLTNCFSVSLDLQDGLQIRPGISKEVIESIGPFQVTDRRGVTETSEVRSAAIMCGNNEDMWYIDENLRQAGAIVLLSKGLSLTESYGECKVWSGYGGTLYYLRPFSKLGITDSSGTNLGLYKVDQDGFLQSQEAVTISDEELALNS